MQVVGCYVGFATVGVFATWYTSNSFLGIDLSGDGHMPISMAQLRNWEQCPTWEGFKVRWVWRYALHPARLVLDWAESVAAEPAGKAEGTLASVLVGG